MNRKNFLAGMIPLATLSTALKAETTSKTTHIISPPYLKQGDLVGITCPSGSITIQECRAAIKTFENWGFQIKLGTTVGSKYFNSSGTDAQRTSDLQQMLDDVTIKAILFGRGGYGALRIIDQLDFTRFATHPKWLIGFSDATVFHFHIHRNVGLATLHSKMCNSFPDDFSKAEPSQQNSIISIQQCLTGEVMKYKAAPNSNNRNGTAKGILIGGNLTIIADLCGSDSDVDTTDKILFIEDVGEYLYKTDALLWNLKRSGKLNSLKGLIVGGFKPKPDDPGEEFGKNIYEMVIEKVKEYNYPVCFDFPVGHIKENYALKCGLVHELKITKEITQLEEYRSH